MHMNRREAIRRILAASAVLASVDSLVQVAEATGIGFDPDLLKKEIPWPALMDEAEVRAATALADLILPADVYGPAASEVGVVDFLNEWISAPYETSVKDRPVIRDGLKWLDGAAKERGGKVFAELGVDEQAGLVDGIFEPESEARRGGHAFFQLFKSRCAAGYFTTREGWKALGYVGNTPMGGDWPEPPEEALRHAGLA